MTADTIDTVELRRQLAEGTPSRSYLLAIMPVVLGRLAAIEAAARAVVDDLEAGRSVRCPVCDAHLRYQEHGRGCSIVALAALLDGAP